MDLTYEKMLKLAERRLVSKNTTDAELVIRDINHSYKTISTFTSTGEVVFSATIIDGKISTLFIRKNNGNYDCTFNKFGRLAASSINTPHNNCFKMYQSLNDTCYLNSINNHQKHLIKHYKYDQESKRTYLRTKTAYDELRNNKPFNGEIIKFTKLGVISARYVFFNGRKQNYRDIIKCEKDKLVISLRNDRMAWVRDNYQK